MNKKNNFNNRASAKLPIFALIMSVLLLAFCAIFGATLAFSNDKKSDIIKANIQTENAVDAQQFQYLFFAIVIDLTALKDVDFLTQQDLDNLMNGIDSNVEYSGFGSYTWNGETFELDPMAGTYSKSGEVDLKLYASLNSSSLQQEETNFDVSISNIEFDLSELVKYIESNLSNCAVESIHCTSAVEMNEHVAKGEWIFRDPVVPEEESIATVFDSDETNGTHLYGWELKFEFGALQSVANLPL